MACQSGTPAITSLSGADTWNGQDSTLTSCLFKDLAMSYQNTMRCHNPRKRCLVHNNPVRTLVGQFRSEAWTNHRSETTRTIWAGAQRVGPIWHDILCTLILSFKYISLHHRYSVSAAAYAGASASPDATVRHSSILHCWCCATCTWDPALWTIATHWHV